MEKSMLNLGDNAQEIAITLNTCLYGNVQGPIKDLLRLMFVTANENDTVYCKLLTN